MNLKGQEHLSRRVWLRTLLRFGALGGLCAIATLLRRKQDGDGPACTDPGLCQACGAFGRCGLPAAQAARKEHKER